MDKKKLPLIIAATLVALVLTASITVYILQKANDDSQTTEEPVPSEHEEAPAEQETEEEIELTEIDPVKNEAASQVEIEANTLLGTDPMQAAEKYQEAAKLYEEAGNLGKAADMNDNALTASSMTPPEELEFGEPVITQ